MKKQKYIVQEGEAWLRARSTTLEKKKAKVFDSYLDAFFFVCKKWKGRIMHFHKFVKV